MAWLLGLFLLLGSGIDSYDNSNGANSAPATEDGSASVASGGGGFPPG